MYNQIQEFREMVYISRKRSYITPSHKELKGNTGSTVTPSSPVVFTVGLFTTGSHPAGPPQRSKSLALEPLGVSHAKNEEKKI